MALSIAWSGAKGCGRANDEEVLNNMTQSSFLDWVCTGVEVREIGCRKDRVGGVFAERVAEGRSIEEE